MKELDLGQIWRPCTYMPGSFQDNLAGRMTKVVYNTL